MSRAPYLPRLSASLNAAVQDISKFVRLNEVAPDQYEEAGFGASANVFRGNYTRGDGEVVEVYAHTSDFKASASNSFQVAVKCVRPKSTDESKEVSKEKIKKQVSRELSIWHSLNGGNNIVELLGIFTGIMSIPSFVCELCPWNLEEYLERKSPLPKHFKMNNILVTSDETAKLCDFGRSRERGDPTVGVSHSSARLAGTIRYMSPELFKPNVDGPTPAADMWAYGCVALEIMCRIPPYHETTSDIEVVRLITNGHPPGNRPSGPRATLVNDTLWSALATCWKGQEHRPTSQEFLDQLLSMLEKGDILASPNMSNLSPDLEERPIEGWPDEVPELGDCIRIEESFGTIASSVRANVWLATLVRKFQGTPTVVIKVPRLNSRAPSRHSGLRQALRNMLEGRFGVQHKNIVDLIGIDSNFEPHPGLVLEYCGLGNLVSYCKSTYINRDEYKRPRSPRVNAFSLISDIVEGLRYMHNYPIPIPQGDLTPENILVTFDGTAKISLFSFGRVLTALPPTLTLSTTTGLLLPFRWMSPELLVESPQPTTASDMWAIGCVSFWILTGLVPYPDYREELAGIETLCGQPPGTLANVYHRLCWITNGIWRLIGRCWSQDPFQRPSALEFSNLLKTLEGKKTDWVPVEVEDLAGKVKDVGSDAPLGISITLWSSQYDWVDQKHETDVRLDMVVYQATYTPHWYSRAIPAVVKVVGEGPIDEKAQALVPSIRHEITIMSQIDHPHLVKFLGIDSSTYDRGVTMVFEFCSDITLEKLLSQPDFPDGTKLIKCITSALTYLHEHENGTIVHGNLQPANIYVLPNGLAKLANFTCSFQYIVGQPTIGRPLSSTISTPLLPSLYLEPQLYDEKPLGHLRLPTTAGDIWSLGTIILSVRN
ncbi:unnamed protein product [Rhizoctonia solani]|uniref:Protein kinase domain-containing protein n=1 Tax=Rhizoctonia solani TaxID=456999 RepID=A0A8H3HVP9_9AGAM|nr:unnamed protein product [Rhizoctonia solani]